jgi:hypothetical protein
MLTLTARQIKQLIRTNRERGIRPSALKHIADDLGVHRSMVTRAVKTPRRYPKLRAHIERVLLVTASEGLRA